MKRQQLLQSDERQRPKAEELERRLTALESGHTPRAGALAAAAIGANGVEVSDPSQWLLSLSTHLDTLTSLAMQTASFNIAGSRWQPLAGRAQRRIAEDEKNTKADVLHVTRRTIEGALTGATDVARGGAHRPRGHLRAIATQCAACHEKIGGMHGTARTMLENLIPTLEGAAESIWWASA